MTNRLQRSMLARTGSCCFVATLIFALAVVTVSAAQPAPKQTVIVVVGSEGAEEFREPFRTWAQRWKTAAEAGDAACHIIGLEPETDPTDREQLQSLLVQHGELSPKPLWLVLIGHGTFNGKVARFNLRGPDLSSAQLADLLKPVARPLAVANCTSSSAPFLADLSGRGRVVLTATRSGSEFNFARFGDYLSASINDPAGDLDKDGQTSLLEAFLLASSRVQEFYASEARLATEHALLDDNGDKLGTPPDWFKGTRAIKSAKDGALPDGRLANTFVLVRSPAEAQLSPEQRARRDALERQLAELRAQKNSFSEEEYYDALEPLLLELGLIAAPPPDSLRAPAATKPPISTH